MKICIYSATLLAIAAIATLPAPAQQPAAPAQQPAAPEGAAQKPVLKTTVDEVVLDFIARDKKGKPVADLTKDDLTVSDNGVKEQPTSFRLVQGADAISQGGTTTKLDPLRQLRLVTLAFEALDSPTQRKTARDGAVDLVKGEQGGNVFYSVVVIDTRLMVLQQFTADKDALIKAIETATSGFSPSRLQPESDKIKSDLSRYLNGQTVNGSAQPDQLLAAAAQTATQPLPTGAAAAASGAIGAAAVQSMLATVMLNMLRMDASAASQDVRLDLNALESLVRGLQAMPGRKSVLYFSRGMLLTPELDAIFRNLTSMANRANVTFYSVDTRGVMTFRQNAGASAQLNHATSVSANTTLNEGSTTQDEMMASDTAEDSSRANVQLPIRNLAEATGGFLLGESNDLRTPLRKVNEEIASYYELTYDPHIDNYDGSFHKLKLDSDRKNVVLQARNGYFALPPEARAAGLEAFELPLLKAISDGRVSQDVEFRAGAFLEQPRSEGRDLSLLVEIPLHGMQAKPGADQKGFDIHFSVVALVKDAKGEVAGQKLTRDHNLNHITADQLKMGNFVDKMSIELPPGQYSLETAVMDRESGKIGFDRSAFTVASAGKGVGISSMASVRSYIPNAKGLDPNEPFQYQGGSITPTWNSSVPRSANSSLRLFFVVYKDPSISAKPTLEIELLQNGKSLQKVPLPLDDADAQGRIPDVLTIPASAIPAGVYQVRAVAKQGSTESETQTDVKIEAN
ncbi:MAG: VWA domain-containing protein [Bryobacteraceae bacterium]|jgi:VWFA-related protein